MSNRYGVVEGDLLLDFDEATALYGRAGAERLATSNRFRFGAGDLTHSDWMQQRLWRRRDQDGVIVSYIADSLNQELRNQVESAMREFQRVTKGAVKFAQWDAKDSDFIMFMPTEGTCTTHLGRIGGAQKLNVGPSCSSSTQIQHLLMHALGLAHEQSRPDRNLHVNINLTATLPGSELDFMPQVKGPGLGLPYDRRSVLHFGPYEFASSLDTPTITSLVDTDPLIPNTKLSKLDIARVRLTYRCEGGPRRFADACSPDCPCMIDEWGDCDTHHDCKYSARCQFGNSGTERCVNIWDLCSVHHPCPAGEGHCNSDEDCQGILFCGTKRNALGIRRCEDFPKPSLSLEGKWGFTWVEPLKEPEGDPGEVTGFVGGTGESEKSSGLSDGITAVLSTAGVLGAVLGAALLFIARRRRLSKQQSQLQSYVITVPPEL